MKKTSTKRRRKLGVRRQTEAEKDHSQVKGQHRESKRATSGIEKGESDEKGENIKRGRKRGEPFKRGTGKDTKRVRGQV